MPNIRNRSLLLCLFTSKKNRIITIMTTTAAAAVLLMTTTSTVTKLIMGRFGSTSTGASSTATRFVVQKQQQRTVTTTVTAFSMNQFGTTINTRSKLLSLSSSSASSYTSSSLLLSSSTKTPTIGTGIGILRRQRPIRDGDYGCDYVKRMKREKGLYPDFIYGHFIEPQSTSSALWSTAEETSASTTAESTTSVDDDDENETNNNIDHDHDDSTNSRSMEYLSSLSSLSYHPSSLPEVFPLEGKSHGTNDIPVRMRFAPSPTGSLHVGGARTALYNYLVAKKAQYDALVSTSSSTMQQQQQQQQQQHTAMNPKQMGSFVLRIEDTDVARSTKESEESVLSDLRWLGLHWDEGPDMPHEVAKYGPYRQSERNHIYLAAAMKLIQEGKAYRCFCTPEELDEMKAQQEAAGLTFKYDGRWRDADQASINKMLDQQKPYTVRFKVPSGTRVVIDDIVRGTVGWDADMTVGDFILLRSSGIPVYNFCVAVDDACMGIATVVRAEEHLTNTLRQALILDALGAPRPRYAHCSLILGEDKQKLSKRHGATSCDQYRIDGFLPDAMINYLALLGWNDGTDNEIFTRDELIDAFSLERVVKSPSVFDIEKLKWVNGQHLKMMSVNDIIPYVKDQMYMVGIVKDNVPVDDKRVHDFALASTSIAKQMMLTTKDAVSNALTVLGYNLPSSYEEITDPEAKTMIELGTFYPLAMKIIEQYKTGTLPLPIEDNLLAAFMDATGEAIEEDDKKGETCIYTHEYIAHMKNLAKEMNIKGKLFFHPVRLMLTGEMSGQDVTKQLSLVALATKEDSIIDPIKAKIVPFSERMKRLQEFCTTIPIEFRQPNNNVATTTTTTTTTTKSGGSTTVHNANGSHSTSITSDVTNVNGASSSSGSFIDPKDTYNGPPITALDIRVGRILKVWEHEEAEKLYCEEIDVGEENPRQIASGLRPYLKPEDMENRLVLVLCNLKERKLVGFPSHGMVLCASNDDHTIVRLVNPPIDAKIGERVSIPGFPIQTVDDEPYPENKIAKKKIFEELAPYLRTNQYGIPVFLGRPFMTSAGACTSPIVDGSVS